MAKTEPVPDLWPDLADTFPVSEIIDRRIRSRSQLSRDIAAGRLPAFKLGKRIFIRKADLLALVKPVRAAS
jgi:hypothetical protein